MLVLNAFFRQDSLLAHPDILYLSNRRAKTAVFRHPLPQGHFTLDGGWSENGTVCPHAHWQ